MDVESPAKPTNRPKSSHGKTFHIDDVADEKEEGVVAK